MKLFEEGKLRLNDRVQNISRVPGRQVRHHCPQSIHAFFRNAPGHRPVACPGAGTKPVSKWPCATSLSCRRARFTYSDINFILLGEIVRRVSGQTCPISPARQFSNHSACPSRCSSADELRDRIAPTEALSKAKSRLEVLCTIPPRETWEESRTRRSVLDGRRSGALAQMMLQKGSWRGAQIFSR